MVLKKEGGKDERKGKMERKKDRMRGWMDG